MGRDAETSHYTGSQVEDAAHADLKPIGVVLSKLINKKKKRPKPATWKRTPDQFKHNACMSSFKFGKKS